MTLSEEEYANSTDSVLIKSIKCQNWDEVARILGSEQGIAMTKEPDIYDNLPLHVAIGFKAPDETILRILKANPEATKTHGTDYWLPLHVAAMWGVSSLVMEAVIREHPQGLDDCGSGGLKGRTPRHFSGRFKHNQILLERSTDEWIRLVTSETKNEQ